MVNEPTHQWGGTWTEKKLNAFSKYVRAYLTIMSKYPNYKTIYFDGFAGSGDRKEIENTSLYYDLGLNIEDEKVYKGAAERVLTLPNNLSFNYHYFIDLHQESLNKLKVKLEKLQENKTEFQYKSGDSNEWIQKLAEALKSNKNYASLVLLDPFGMQINWESINSLKDTRTDIWILIPTGVIVNRLLDKNCEFKHSEKLQSFFGLDEETIKSIFYSKSIESTLFGPQKTIKKISKPIEKIADVYIERLQTIWKNVTKKPLVLTNSRGVPIYHFVFASNNKHAVKIAKEIISTI